MNDEYLAWAEVAHINPAGCVVPQHPLHFAENCHHRGDVFLGRFLQS